jgi:hypothetical protein
MLYSHRAYRQRSERAPLARLQNMSSMEAALIDDFQDQGSFVASDPPYEASGNSQTVNVFTE